MHGETCGLKLTGGVSTVMTIPRGATQETTLTKTADLTQIDAAKFQKAATNWFELCHPWG